MERSNYHHAISGLTAMSSPFQPPIRTLSMVLSWVLYPRNANKTHGSSAGKLATLPLYLSAPVLTLCWSKSASLVRGVLAHTSTLVLITTPSIGKVEVKKEWDI